MPGLARPTPRRAGDCCSKKQRAMRFRPQAGGQWLLVLDLTFAAPKEPVTLGKTNFGLIGVRMAKTIGVHDGGGTIRNSEGGVNEAGRPREAGPLGRLLRPDHARRPRGHHAARSSRQPQSSDRVSRPRRRLDGGRAELRRAADDRARPAAEASLWPVGPCGRADTRTRSTSSSPSLPRSAICRRSRRK